MPIRMSGVPSCTSCRRAQAAFRRAGKSVQFRDLREDPPTPDEVARLWQAVGPRLLNRASTTWRDLSKDEQAGDPVALMVAHPTLIKRPVIEDGERITIGWSDEQQQEWLP